MTNCKSGLTESIIDSRRRDFSPRWNNHRRGNERWRAQVLGAVREYLVVCLRTYVRSSVPVNGACDSREFKRIRDRKLASGRIFLL